MPKNSWMGFFQVLRWFLEVVETPMKAKSVQNVIFLHHRPPLMSPGSVGTPKYAPLGRAKFSSETFIYACFYSGIV